MLVRLYHRSAPYKTNLTRFLMTSFPNALRFDKTHDQIQAETTCLLQEWKSVLDQVASQPVSHQNTLLPFLRMDSTLGTQINNLSFFSSVSDSKQIRDASIKAEEQFDQFFIDLDMREDIYSALNAYHQTNPVYSSPEEQRYLERLLRDYRRNGMDKDPETRAQIKALQKKIGDLERDASQNMNEDITKTEFSLEELEGLPQPILDSFKDVEGKQGYKWVTLKYPDVLPTMRFAKRESTRQKMDYINQNKCASTNTAILEQLVELRHQLAILLGYNSIAEYILSIRMAQHPQAVQDFEQSLIDQLQQAGRQELDSLIALKCQHTGESHYELQSWDNAYYNNLMKETQYQVDEQLIKNYFPTQHVIKETFAIYQELLGLKFARLNDAHVWNKEVECWDVHDAASQAHLGQFYLDLYPRDGKYGHAAAFPLIKRAVLDEQVVLPVAAMVCNFARATEPNKDSLMDFSEVETFFHEFGHIMHNICSEATMARFSGTSVERDFVELPSQMLENWCWDKDILARLSRHPDTGESLPHDLVQRKLAVKNLNNALFTLRQVQLGVFDHLLHTAHDQTLLHTQGTIADLRRNMTKDGLKIDTASLFGQTKESIAMIKHHPGTNFAANFGHLMGGYQAQYYGYLWSQVYSCDLFQQFLEQGIMNQELGLKYRKLILGPGGSRDSMELIKEFLGREPNQTAFLQQNGFIQ